MVCKGFMQREGIDFVEAFAPVAKFQSIRCFIAIAAYYGLMLEQMDVVTAFLNPDVISSFPKILKFWRNSRKELLLFVC